MNATTAIPTTPTAAPPDLRTSAADRLGSRWWNCLRALFGPPTQRRLGRAALQIDRIRHWEQEYARLSDEEVRLRGLQMRGRARGGESLDKVLPEVFGLVCTAAYRNLRMRPYDVQLAAGVVLHHCALAEVATGEGKTLVATLPTALHALLGKGAHVTTTNDYLAKRDAEWTSQVYSALGLTVGVLQQKMPDQERVRAYRCDITYGTASEFGFDFLRDRLKVSGDRNQGMPFWTPWTTPNGHFTQPLDPKVQRGHHFALVDEADNIFVDEAKTPLIISGGTRKATEEESVVYLWADDLAKQMARDEHYTLDEKKQKIELTEEGRSLVRYSNPPVGEHSHAMDKLHEHVERALQAHFRFRKDQHYMLQEGKVVIIDESTGRPMPDRHWREGLHQAVEAKERVAINKAADHAAQITFQRFFRLYKHLAGMSGTAWQNWWEVRRVYKLWVVCVPTNRPVMRKALSDRVLPTEDAKFRAVTEDVVRLRAEGRPVLVGTRSVEKSEKLSEMLTASGVPHEVLNARPENAAREADIVAQAGRAGAVTIATNMAGRGTDILLGGNAEPFAWERLKEKYRSRADVPVDEWKRTVSEIEAAQGLRELGRQVAAAGGLHVIGTERHEALRIDRQLAGRSGRQGDPGSCQFFLSLEDELLEALGPRKQANLKEVGRRGGGRDWQAFHKDFMKAQKRLEARHYKQRVDLLVYEKQRQEVLKDLGADPYVD